MSETPEDVIYRIIRDDNAVVIDDFAACIERAATMLPSTLTLRQFLIFLKFAKADLKGTPISLQELKDKYDAEDQYGGKLFAKTTSAAFGILFEAPADLDGLPAGVFLNWLYKEQIGRTKLIKMTDTGRKALFLIMGKVAA